MDLKQPISLKGIGKSEHVAYPTKSTINLVTADQSRNNIAVQLALFVVVLVLVAIFAKFAVIDPLAQGAASDRQVVEAQVQLDQLVAANENYAELNQEYERYVVTGLTQEEQNTVDRDAVLDLLEEKVLNVGYLSSLKVSGNVASATCLGVNLANVSQLVQSLESDSRVAHVTVTTAQGETDASNSATIDITFVGALDSSDSQGDVDEMMSQATGEGAAL